MRVSTWNILALLVALPAFAQIQSNVTCESAEQVQGCMVDYVSETDARGSTQTVRFGAQHRAGVYANGDVWVVGPVDLVATEPEPVWTHDPFSSGRRRYCQADVNAQGCIAHGYQLGSDNVFENRLDCQRSRDQAALPCSGNPFPLPLRIDPSQVGSISLLKASSRLASYESKNQSCDKGMTDGWGFRTCFLGLMNVTIVNAPPDTDGDGFTNDEIRPPIWGPGPTLNFRLVEQWAARSFPGLNHEAFDMADAESLLPLERIATSGRGARLWIIKGNFSDNGTVIGTNSATYGCAYNADAAVCRANAALRLMFLDADPRGPGRQAWANWLTIGRDLCRAKTGRTFNPEHWSDKQSGWGGHQTGRMLWASIAARVLGTEECVEAVTDMANGGGWDELAKVTVRGGIPYMGHDGGFCSRSPTVANGYLGNGTYNAYCAPGGSDQLDVTCSGNRDYGRVWQHLGPAHALAIRLFDLWELWGSRGYAEHYDRWGGSIQDGGRGAGHARNNYCGPTNAHNGNWGTNQASTSNRRVVIAERMWPVYSGAEPPEPPEPGEEPVYTPPFWLEPSELVP